jgi:short subunit fatty acids transporter
MILGGGLALSSHGTKAATRLAANASPEPVSNIALSLTDDVVAFGSTILMAFFPVVMLVIVIIFLILTIWLTPKIVRALRRLIARLRGLFGSDPQQSSSR